MSETPSNFDQPDREPTVHEQDKQRSHITQALSFIEQGFTLPEIKNVSVDPYFVFSERFLKDEMNKFTLEQWNSFKKEISILLARSKTIVTQLRTYIGNKGDFKPDESEINDSDVVGRTTYILPEIPNVRIFSHTSEDDFSFHRNAYISVPTIDSSIQIQHTLMQYPQRPSYPTDREIFSITDTRKANHVVEVVIDRIGNPPGTYLNIAGLDTGEEHISPYWSPEGAIMLMQEISEPLKLFSETTTVLPTLPTPDEPTF